MRSLLLLCLIGCAGPTHQDAARDIAAETCARARDCGADLGFRPDCEALVVAAVCDPTRSPDPTLPTDPLCPLPDDPTDGDALARCLAWVDGRVCHGQGSWDEATDCMVAVGRVRDHRSAGGR